MNSKYKKEFKEEAVKLSDDVGVKAAADQFGISYSTLCRWRSKRKQYGKHAFVGSGHQYQNTEGMSRREIELQREIAELRRANDILKDALGFFAKDRKK